MSENLTLAITKIGDLLLGNFITCDKYGNSIAVSELKIPEYQRPYKWSPKNVLQLFNDIFEARNENKEVYRVGTLILHKDTNSQDEIIYNIVDGQQRLITFAMLLDILFKAKAESSKQESAEMPIDEELSENAKYSNIIFLNQELISNEHNLTNIPLNYNALRLQVERISNAADTKLISDLLEYVENNCELIVIITGDESEAFQFFDSQNARGKKLYPHDLLKAYHLREMNDLDTADIEGTVKSWEELPQNELSGLFNEYLYCIKEWTSGNKSDELTEQNIDKFKGITQKDNYPYAQFFKSAYAYADMVNSSKMPFVSGSRSLRPYQLNAPIIAGKPFFDYAGYYFSILKDIQDNNKYRGQYINGNKIVETLEQKEYKSGTGNIITRRLFDTAVLLYIDRFCPDKPDKSDTELLEQFVIYAFIWAYSLRAQYTNLGWVSAQNYIMEISGKRNSLNIYKIISDVDSPHALLRTLAKEIKPLSRGDIFEKFRDENRRKERINKLEEEVKEDKENSMQKEDKTKPDYLYYFIKHNFLEIKRQNDE